MVHGGARLAHNKAIALTPQHQRYSAIVPTGARVVRLLRKDRGDFTQLARLDRRRISSVHV